MLRFKVLDFLMISLKKMMSTGLRHSIGSCQVQFENSNFIMDKYWLHIFSIPSETRIGVGRGMYLLLPYIIHIFRES